MNAYVRLGVVGRAHLRSSRSPFTRTHSSSPSANEKPLPTQVKRKVAHLKMQMPAELELADAYDTSITLKLSANRRITIYKWGSVKRVDIREYYLKDDEYLPGRKGISLTLSQWDFLKDNIGIIDSAIRDLS